MTNDLTPAYPITETPTDLVPYTTHGHNIIAATPTQPTGLEAAMLAISSIEDMELQDIAIDLYTEGFMGEYIKGGEMVNIPLAIDAVLFATSEEQLDEETGEISTYPRTSLRVTHEHGKALDTPKYVTFGSEKAYKYFRLQAMAMRGTVIKGLGVIDASRPWVGQWKNKDLEKGRRTYSYAGKCVAKVASDGKK